MYILSACHAFLCKYCNFSVTHSEMAKEQISCIPILDLKCIHKTTTTGILSKYRNPRVFCNKVWQTLINHGIIPCMNLTSCIQWKLSDIQYPSHLKWDSHAVKTISFYSLCNIVMCSAQYRIKWLSTPISEPFVKNQMVWSFPQRKPLC